MANLRVGQLVRIVYTVRQFWREGSEDVIISDMGVRKCVNTKKMEHFYRLAGDMEPGKGIPQGWMTDQLEPVVPSGEDASLTRREEIGEGV